MYTHLDCVSLWVVQYRRVGRDFEALRLASPCHLKVALAHCGQEYVLNLSLVESDLPMPISIPAAGVATASHKPRRDSEQSVR